MKFLFELIKKLFRALFPVKKVNEPKAREILTKHYEPEPSPEIKIKSFLRKNNRKLTRGRKYQYISYADSCKLIRHPV